MFYKGIKIGQALKKKRQAKENDGADEIFINKNGIYNTPTEKYATVNVPLGKYPSLEQMRRVFKGKSYQFATVGNVDITITIKDIYGDESSINPYTILFHVKFKGYGTRPSYVIREYGGGFNTTSMENIKYFDGGIYTLFPKNKYLKQGMKLDVMWLVGLSKSDKYNILLNSKPINPEYNVIIGNVAEDISELYGKEFYFLDNIYRDWSAELAGFRAKLIGYPILTSNNIDGQWSGDWTYEFDVPLEYQKTTPYAGFRRLLGFLNIKMGDIE